VDQMLTFGDYMAVVRRRKWWVIGAVAVCLLLALAYSNHQTPKYQAESTVVVGNVSPPTFFGGGGGSSGTSIERYVATQATIGSSNQVATLTVQDPKAQAGSISPKQFVAMSSVTADATANTLHFTVVAHSADQAISLANAFAYQYTQRAKTLLEDATQPTIDGLNKAIATYGPNQITALQTARENLLEVTNFRTQQEAQTTVSNQATSATKAQPKTTRNLLIGLAFGIALGLALAYIIEAADDRIYTVRQFAAASGLPVIGKLPPLRTRLRRRSVDEVGNLTREQARVIAARLAFARNASHAKMLLVTGADPVGGSSDVSTWLAWGLAEIGHRVVLIDLDYAHGDDAAELLSLPGAGAGASGVIERGGSFETAGVSVPVPGSGSLTVISPGAPPADTLRVATSPGLHLLLEEARQHAEVVLVNAPALTDSSFAVVLTGLADALVISARLPRTRTGDVTRLRDALSGTPTPPLGAVVVGGEGYPDATSVPPMAPGEGGRNGGLLPGGRKWTGDVVSQRT
jgi:capsular polysaccharide biosynthesis protein/Mrp family chromosome partitioning ATPase